MIKRLIARQEEGLFIVWAIELLRSQIAQGNNPLEQIEPAPSLPVTTLGTLESL